MPFGDWIRSRWAHLVTGVAVVVIGGASVVVALDSTSSSARVVTAGPSERFASALLPASTTTSTTTTTTTTTAPPEPEPAAPSGPAPAPAPAPSGCPAPGASSAYLSLVNDARIAAGLCPLGSSGGLAGAATAWAQHIAAIGQPVHSGLPNGAGAMGEVIAFGPASTAPAAFVNAWLGSGSHRPVLLGPYSVAGVGTATVNGNVYVVMQFA